MTEPFVTDPWIVIACGAIVIVVFCCGLLVPRRSRTVRAPVTDTKLDALGARLTTLERKQDRTDHDVRGIRMSIEAMPTARSVNDIAVQVASLTGKVEGMQQALAANTHSLARIEDFLMEAGAKRIAGTSGDGLK